MKKYKLINNKTKEETICSLVTIDGFDYYVSNETIKDVRLHNGKWQIEKGRILNKFPDYLTDLSECKLVIATNNPNIEIPQVTDEVDDIIKNAFYDENGDFKRSTIGADDWVNGLKLGYNKAKELSPNTNEDMIEFNDWVYRNQFDIEGYTQDKETKELLQLWKLQQPIKIYYE